MKSKKILFILVPLAFIAGYLSVVLVAGDRTAGGGLLTPGRGGLLTSSEAVQTKEVTVSSASFAELATTSFNLLPAPASGKAYQIVSVSVTRQFSSESWDRKNISAPTIGFKGSTHKGAAITASVSQGVFTGGALWSVASPSVVTLYPVSHVATSSAVVLRRDGATEPVIDGDTSFKFFILYRLIDSP